VHVVECGVGKPFAVSCLIVDDCDLLPLELVAGELGPDHALLIIAAAGVERIPQLAIRDLGIGC
jgi:hypothetical protein